MAKTNSQARPFTFAEKIYALRQFYRKSPYLFGKEVLGLDFIPQSIRRWEKYLLENINLADVENQTEQKFFLFEMPRETFKSTFFTTIFPAWALAINPNLAIMITSATQSNSKNWLSAIKRRLERDLFIDVFGNWKTRDDWRDTDIIISQRDRIRPESSIFCAGLDTTTTSKHFDIIVADDLVTPEDRDSPAKRAKTIKYWDDIIDLLHKRHGICFFIGTPWHWDDLYQWIERKNVTLKKEGKPEVKVLKEPAYIEKEGKRVFLFPDILPEEKLNDIRARKSDISNFSANYLLRPIHPSSQIFKEDALQYFNYRQEFPGNLEKVCFHIDPSQDDKSGNDYTAIVVVGKRKSDGRRLVLDTRIELMRPSRRETAVLELYKFYLENGIPGDMIETRWQIETVAGQNEIKRSLLRFMLDNGVADFPLKSLARVANKHTKIASLELPISNGSLLFRDDFRTAPGGYYLLIQQLLEFPQGHDDGPDALKEAFDLTEGKGEINFATV